ncbi:hypothetical protein R6Q57_003314 [Mikania cordata]
MAEEVRITGTEVNGDEDYERVSEWEDGLPDVDDVTPLTRSLISSELLSAFNITPEPFRSMVDVNRASQNTLSNLQQSFTRFDSSKSVIHDNGDAIVVEGDETADLTPGGSDYQNIQRTGCDGGDVAGGGAIVETGMESDFHADDPSTRASKRPRLVWTPQLHKRFIEVVAHLGVKNAVPKTIMQMMNVEGLTRENVASHLQKYRLYLKRMQGLPTRGCSSSDQVFGSSPATQNSHSSGAGNGYRPPPAAIPMPYHPPQMVHHMSYASQQMVPQRYWSGNKFDSVSAYLHRGTPDK